MQLAMSPPPAGRSRWTTRLLARTVGLTSGCFSDILRKNGLKPHLVRTYKVSRDPQFVAKVQDVVGLYLNPPEHAVVLSVDEKTSIQALERTQLPLPMRSGRAARHTHDYTRNGVVDLYAALELKAFSAFWVSSRSVPRTSIQSALYAITSMDTCALGTNRRRPSHGPSLPRPS